VAERGRSVIRVLIAEDQYLMREGTKRLLEDQPGIEVVGVAADGTEVTQRALAIRPDVVLMDIKMPPTHTMEGIAAAHAIKQRRPEIGVIVLSQHDDEEYVSALLEHGAEGYVRRVAAVLV
jgi:DNA-binding NarL/FixJ family response regulator